MTTYNPRYVAYAAAHGRSPADMLAEDKDCWPGVRMVGFILWIGRQWEAWRAANGRKRDDFLTAADHASFDAWLAALALKEKS